MGMGVDQAGQHGVAFTVDQNRARIRIQQGFMAAGFQYLTLTNGDGIESKEAGRAVRIAVQIMKYRGLRIFSAGNEKQKSENESDSTYHGSL